MIAGVLIAMERAPLGFGIRWSTQSGDEGRGNSNHTANWFQLDEGQDFLIHSVAKGTRELIDWAKVYDRDRYWGVVVVPIGYTEDEHWEVLAKSREYLGMKYDRCAIAKHFLDGIAGKLFRRPIYFFRRFRLKFWKRQDRYNICSWLSCRTWGSIGHRVIGLVRMKRRWFRKARFKKAKLDCRFVAPNDWERDAFLHNPASYRVVREVGKRPRDLGPEWTDKIKADLARGTFDLHAS
jgi:hypothetical protein